MYIVKSTVYSVQCTVSSEHLALLLECAGVSKGQGTVDRSLLGKWRGNGLVRQGSLVGEVEEVEVREEEARNKSSWSEHVWSTFIHRGGAEDVTETVRTSASASVSASASASAFASGCVHVRMCMCIYVCIVGDVSVRTLCLHMLVLMCMRTCTSYVLPTHVTNARMCPTFVSCMCVCVFVSVCRSVCMFACGYVCLWVCVCARAYMHLCLPLQM